MKLTVGDLKKLIEGQLDDASVLLQMQDGCCGDTLDLEFSDSTSSLEYQGKQPGYVVLTVEAVPGYRSCRQSRGTKRSDERYWQDPKGPKEEGTEQGGAEALRRFKLFRMRIRNALSRSGIMSNHSWTEDDIVKAIEKLGEKHLEKAPPINTLKLNYLRKEARMARQCSETAAKAAANGDPDQWDQSRLFLGQAWAFEQMIGYTRGLNHRQIGIATRKGKL